MCARVAIGLCACVCHALPCHTRFHPYARMRRGVPPAASPHTKAASFVNIVETAACAPKTCGFTKAVLQRGPHGRRGGSVRLWRRYDLCEPPLAVHTPLAFSHRPRHLSWHFACVTPVLERNVGGGRCAIPRRRQSTDAVYRAACSCLLRDTPYSTMYNISPE